MARKFFLTLFILISAVVFVPLEAVLASTTDGTISGYAWSAQIGWINFGTTNGNARITDSAVTGYAWNENTGWINLDPAQSGVTNNSSGTLAGKAWGEGIGWIDFSGVTVSSAGVFAGTATADNSISITFDCTNCNITTDWRPASVRNAGSVSASFSGGGSVGVTKSGSVIINGGQAVTGSREVILSLDAGSDPYKMSISHAADFPDAVTEDFAPEKPWTLSEGDGVKTVYVRFYYNSGVNHDVSDAIALDTSGPDIRITSVKPEYGFAEDVVISGETELNANVTLLIDDRYAAFTSDAYGRWTVSLGKLAAGPHRVRVYARDSFGNAGPSAFADFSVAPEPLQEPVVQPQQPAFLLPDPLAPILRKLGELVEPLLPGFLKPIAKEEPKPLVTVPKEAPLALKGKAYWFPEEPLEIFALAPLPKDVKVLAQKFPQVQKTFSQVGVNKITDVQKLSRANLKLPTLTESVLPAGSFAAGGVKAIGGIPVAKLSVEQKNKIPSAVIFAKGAGGLVDLNVALSVNRQGSAEQKIRIVAGQPIDLVLKADQPAKKVTGYVVFKSKQYNRVTYGVPRDALAPSSIFSGPNFAAALAPSVKIFLQGDVAQNSPAEGAPAPSEDRAVEQRFVLSTFEYTHSGQDVYTATLQPPVVDGEYEIISVMEYADPSVQSKEIKLITLVDPEGYIYEKNGNFQTRISGAVVSLFKLNPENSKYELWPARDFQQENPQTTDARGTYSFLVPEGFYYLKVDAPGYKSYEGKAFEVKEGSGVHINVEMKTHYWFLNIVDWKTLLLVLVVMLLLYNFYRDKMRERKQI